MSSILLRHSTDDDQTVTVSWVKGNTFEVCELYYRTPSYIRQGHTKTYGTERSAVRAAQRVCKRLGISTKLIKRGEV
jgi:hypothetical protein